MLFVMRTRSPTLPESVHEQPVEFVDVLTQPSQASHRECGEAPFVSSNEPMLDVDPCLYQNHSLIAMGIEE